MADYRTFTVSIPDSYIYFEPNELEMIEQIINLKLDYSTDSEKETCKSILNKLYPAKRYHDRIERAKAGFI